MENLNSASVPEEPEEGPNNVEPDRMAQPVDIEGPPRLPFPVVGIGASAGGLEAYSEFFKVMRPDGGMAFVLIQHLPPDRESLVAEILSRHTKMPVQQIEDGMPVLVDHVYVIRPGFTVTIREGKLHLGERLEKPMNNRPVDDFFKSLADEQRERAICIVMSGMGSNGSAGAQAIKAVGGLCIAQDPETAQFPSMPRHLIEAGYSDYILRPQDMPDVLLAYAGHPYAQGRHTEDLSHRRDQQHLREILAVLRTRTRHDFSGYKKATVLRRVQRRMGMNRVVLLGEYAKILRQSPTEVTGLSDDMLIHVTGFFRDAQAWENLREQVIVPLVKSRDQEASIRCWVTACSSGEEAYSLAILLVEESERAGKRLDIKVFATDTAERTLSNARAGLYPGGIEAEVTPERLDRFFQREDEVYRVRQELRERVVFAPQNVLQDPPFSRLDIITCRNLLIYLEPAVQLRVLALLHFGLREGGALFLGSSETIAGLDEMFEPIDKKTRIFRRIGPTRHGSVEFPLPRSLFPAGGPRDGVEDSGRWDRRSLPRPSIAQQTAKVLLEEHSPAAVTIDGEGRIVYFHGNTGPYLDQPRGEPTRVLMAIVVESVRGAVRTALHRAAAAKKRVTILDGFIENVPGRRKQVAVTASPLDLRGMPGYFVVSFDEREEAPASSVPTSDTSKNGKPGELERLRDELQMMVEELQTSNEELKASNEEVTSVNEELQSSNEELETSREEMQSLNEELSTVNSQLQTKIEEQQGASNDMASLLSSTDIGVIFLDTRFRIRRFTPAARDLVEVIATDVGRALTDLAWRFTDADLVADAAAVLSRLVPSEREITAEGGRWYMRRVTPYRTIDNRIEGVVVTFVNITQRKAMEEALSQSEQRYRLMVVEVRDYAIFMMNEQGRIGTWNSGAQQIIGYVEGEIIGKPASILFTPEDRAAGEDMKEIQTALAEGQAPDERWHLRKDGTRFWASGVLTTLRDANGHHLGFSKVMRDNTERRAAEQTRLLLSAIVESSADAIYAFTLEGKIITWNPAAERMFGYRAVDAIGASVTMLVPDDALTEHQAILTRLRRGESIYQVETERRRSDGTRISVSFTAAPVQPTGPGAGELIAAALVQDITGRKRDANAIVQAKESADAANRMKDDFLATLSHELRTPLSAIVMWAKVLARGASDPGQLAEGLQAIVRSAMAQEELIEDLLDSSRITTGKLRVHMREIDLVAVVREAVEAISPTAKTKSIEIGVHLQDQVGIVRADPDRIRQVVWNLLTNAVKFSSARRRVDVSVNREGDEVRIIVADTGRGIEAAFLPHVFERFRQADGVSTRLHGGLGLGLAIVKQLVELHGGVIEAQSQGLDKGSTFTVRLPLPKLQESEPVAKTRQGRKPAIGAKLEHPDGLRVLLVEDEIETRNAVAMALRRAGLHVTAVDSAVNALKSFDAARPNVIISDIGLPEEDGYSLMRGIRAREAAAGGGPVPAIALTAFATDQDKRRAREAGFQKHLAKPVEPEKLLSAVRGVIKKT